MINRKINKKEIKLNFNTSIIVYISSDDISFIFAPCFLNIINAIIINYSNKRRSSSGQSRSNCTRFQCINCNRRIKSQSCRINQTIQCNCFEIIFLFCKSAVSTSGANNFILSGLESPDFE